MPTLQCRSETSTTVTRSASSVVAVGDAEAPLGSGTGHASRDFCRSSHATFSDAFASV